MGKPSSKVSQCWALSHLSEKAPQSSRRAAGPSLYPGEDWVRPPSGSVGASAPARPLPARLGDDHLGANLVKALPEFCSLQIYPRRLGRGQRGPWPGQDGRRGPFRGASRGRQRGRAGQEAVLTAAWTAKGRERTGKGSRGEAAREEGPLGRRRRKVLREKGELRSLRGPRANRPIDRQGSQARRGARPSSKARLTHKSRTPGRGFARPRPQTVSRCLGL